MARFSPGTMAAAIFAILIGLTGAFAVRQYLHNPQVAAIAEKKEAPRPLLVPTAANDLPAGRTLTMSDIVITSIRAADVKTSKFNKKPFMPNVQQILGRTLVKEHKKGEAFLPEMLYPEGMGPSVLESLQPGFAEPGTEAADAAHRLNDRSVPPPTSSRTKTPAAAKRAPRRNRPATTPGPVDR